MFLTHDKYIETADDVLDRFNDRRIDQVEGMRLLESLNASRNAVDTEVADAVCITTDNGVVGVRYLKNDPTYEGEDGA